MAPSKALARTFPSAAVKAALKQRIAQGGWQPGTRPSPGRELVPELGCVRMTVHRALRELEEKGLIERPEGSGSFAAELHPISNLVRVRDIAEAIAERGHVHATREWRGCRVSRVSRVSRAAFDAGTASALRWVKGATVVRARLVHCENGVSIQFEDRHINPALAPEPLEHDFTGVTPSFLLFEPAPWIEAEQVVEAIVVTAEMARRLDVARGSALLMVSRRTMSQGAVTSVARHCHPGTRYRPVGRVSV